MSPNPKEGLTGEDMSAYVGIPVTVVHHDNFPYSRELRENGYLPEDRLAERSAAVSRYLEEAGLSKLSAYAPLIAAVPSADSSLIKRRLDLSRIRTDEFGAWNPHEINRRYLLSANSDDAESRDRWVVAPEPYAVNDENNFSQPGICSQAFVIASPLREAPEIYWSFYTGLPARLITNAPDAQMGQLSTSCHEMRHLIQVHDAKLEYYAEIDADLFARAVLRDQLPALKTDSAKSLQQNLFFRYASFLVSSRSHQIAPAIEAFEARESPPDARDIGAVLGEISGRIIEKETGVFSEQQDDEFARRCLQEPEVMYSLLRRCAEDGAFSRNPLADHIAHRVLEAVEYFSEGLTRNPTVVNKIYPVLAP